MFALKIKVDLPNLLLPSESVNLSAFYCIEEPVLLCSPDINVGNRPIRCGIFYEAKGGDRFAQHPGLGLGIGGGPGVCADTGPVDSKTTRRKVEMKLKIKLVLIVAVLALFASVATVLAANNQHAKMMEFAGPTATPGTVINGSQAKLTRGDGEIWITVKTTELPVGAYSNWWVIWNDPGSCTEGNAPLLCGGGDIVLGQGDVSIFWAAGGVTNRNGVGHFSAHLEEGPVPAGLFDGDNATDPADQVRIPGNGLVSAQASEVHYIIRYHGPAQSDPVDLASQTDTIGGFCDTTDTGDCYDPQATGFLGQ